MRFTKYSQSCIRFEDSDRVLVIDPGAFSETDQALPGAEAILISHEHVDHIDEDVVRRYLKENGDARMWAPPGVAANFGELGDRVAAVQPGITFEAAGFRIQTFGGQHAVIHPQIPVVTNVGYLINETVYHPGDSFSVPNVPVPVVLVPLHAPWSKFAEVADFVIAMRAERAYQIHDVMLSEIGRNITETNLVRVTEPYGVTFEHLEPGQTVGL